MYRSIALFLSCFALSAAAPAQIVLANGEPDPAYPWLYAWFDAGVGVNSGLPTANGDPVLSWDDRSVSGHHLRQTPPGTDEQPLWLAEAANAWPALSFDGDDAIWGNESTEFGTMTEERTIFLVARVDPGQDACYLLDSANSFGRNSFLTGQPNFHPGRWQLFTGVETVLSSDVGYEMFQVHTLYFGNGFQEHFLNGALQGTGTAALQNLRGVTLGARYNLQDFLVGQVAETLFYSQPVTQADREAVEAYLVRKYLEPRPSLSSSPLLPGQPVSFTISGCTPHGAVYLAYSMTGPGPTSTTWGTAMLSPPVRPIPPCPADANGDAMQTAFVPGRVSGRPVWIQAMDGESLQMSNVLAEVIG